jgi:hypothetical protein
MAAFLANCGAKNNISITHLQTEPVGGSINVLHLTAHHFKIALDLK